MDFPLLGVVKLKEKFKKGTVKKKKTGTCNTFSLLG